MAAAGVAVAPLLLLLLLAAPSSSSRASSSSLPSPPPPLGAQGAQREASSKADAPSFPLSSWMVYAVAEGKGRRLLRISYRFQVPDSPHNL